MCWPAAMQASLLEKSYFFHRNDMFGTPVFTSSEYWVSFSFSRAQSYVLVVVLFSNLLCFILMTYLNIIILKTSRKKNELRIKLKWTTTYNDVLSLICYSHLYIIMIIHSDSTINSSLQGLLSTLGKPKSNPVQQVSFYSDKVNKNDTISEHDERWK